MTKFGETSFNILDVLEPTLQFGFLAARAMPDGALAVAIKIGSSVQIMRLYLRSLDQTIRRDFPDISLNGRNVFAPARLSHDAHMDFVVTDTLIIDLGTWDEHTFHQKIPQYKEIPAMETKLLA